MTFPLSSLTSHFRIFLLYFYYAQKGKNSQNLLLIHGLPYVDKECVVHKMLVIEDNKAIAKVIEHIGKTMGYEVTVLHTFSEVKQLLVHHQDFFVATVDFSLPDAYEGQVIPYILEYDIPCIVMTGRVSDKIHHDLLNLPIIDYITKENTQAYHYLQRVLKGQRTNHRIGVLVVDDSLSVRSYVCSLLSRRNFTIYSEPDGTKALQSLEDNDDIKLVITDSEMPGMTGIELIQNIRKTYAKRNLIIIGYSGLNKSYQTARFIKSGADDYLTKPFCPEEFYCRIFKNIEQLTFIEDMEISAKKDRLTALPNRESFIDVEFNDFDEMKENSTAYMLAIFHVDKFNHINETDGCLAADEVLIKTAEILSDYFSEYTISRLYGAEFACLLSEESLQKNKKYLTEFLKINGSCNTSSDDKPITFSLSIGAVEIREQATVYQCIEQADEVLSKVKGLMKLRFYESVESLKPITKAS